ncbi:amino acid ABC transporter ATP-binding protein [Ancylobacter pratisalsi]|uniref:Amino acid ABC transporter ATP-binding protein n=1 Tax=Ancylobacter pratisalsi TaxID=1745854 RepID=A0A6P1YJP7_9HYPH|nr:amino acid ABC transporter ATP-binding protein [Ancylobacter pratisalsi]QIB33528.1 amino acid ABC transporter ATP-binding protein [Ancylobacter pratisalsi]
MSGPKGRDLVVEMAGINKWYGEHHALRDIALGLASGEKIVLCGPSGSGKSTLIRCINGLEPFQEGDLRVCGIQLDGSDEALAHIRQRAGMVFQNFNLFPHLSVLENLTLGAIYARGEPEHTAVERAHALLARVQLTSQTHKFPGQLSGGQRQRVAIARALMLEPEVMLFDEPTSALDPEMVHEVLDVMEELARAGQSMIVVTHEMGFARRVADLVVFMDRGEIVEAAPPELFFEAPTSDRAKAFIGQISHAT